MKLTKLIATAVLALGSLSMQAQGIEFMPEGSTFAEAVAKAKAENKMIFLDCYTSWCGPCKMMASKIFPTKEVGDFMNPKYVSIKIDMEKGEGPGLNEKLQVSAYPTFIIFNSDGNEVGRFMGGSNAETFMDRVSKNSVDNGSAAMDARFAAGERDPQFLWEYLATLSNAYKRNQCSEVAEILLEGKAETFANDSNLVKIFMQHVANPFCPAFAYTAAHPEVLSAVIGEMPVTMKLRSVWDRYPRTLIKDENGQVSMDQKKFDEYVALMRQCNVADADHYRLSALMNYAERRQNWGEYMDAMEEYVANPAIDMDDMTMAKAARPIMEKCNDKATRDRLKTILEKRYEDLTSGKRQPQTQVGNMKLSRPTTDIIKVLVAALNGEEVKPA